MSPAFRTESALVAIFSSEVTSAHDSRGHAPAWQIPRCAEATGPVCSVRAQEVVESRKPDSCVLKLGRQGC